MLSRNRRRLGRPVADRIRRTLASPRWPSTCAATAVVRDPRRTCRDGARTCARRCSGCAARPNVRPGVDRHGRRVARREPRAAGRRRPAAGARRSRCSRRRSTIAACAPTPALMKRLGGAVDLAGGQRPRIRYALRTLREIAAEPSGPREQHVSSARRARHGRCSTARRRPGRAAGGLAAPLVAILSDSP